MFIKTRVLLIVQSFHNLLLEDMPSNIHVSILEYYSSYEVVLLLEGISSDLFLNVQHSLH